MPFFPKEQIVFKPKGERLIKIEAPFIDEISELVIVKMFDRKARNIMMLKLKVYEILLH